MSYIQIPEIECIFSRGGSRCVYRLLYCKMPYNSNLPDCPLPDKSLSDVLLERIAAFGQDTAIVDNAHDGISITFEELSFQIRRCAGFLYQQSLSKGDVVGLCASTCLEYPVVMFGIMACGATVTLCNPAFSEGEVLQQFSVSEPKMVFADEQALETMKSVKNNLPCLEKIFVMGKSNDYHTFSSMMKPEYEKDFPKDLGINPAEDIAIIPYSSGTTGLPKSVMITHKNFVASSLIGGIICRFKRDDCYYMDRPMYHMGGFGITIFTLLHGIKLVAEKEFDVAKILSSIEKYKVTHLLATPHIMIEMANTEKYRQYDLSSLKQVPCGGAALSAAVMYTLKERYNVQMVPMYGMTECSPIAANNDVDKFLTSVGSITPNTIVKIIDLETGKELGYDKDGEILAKGPQVMKGYLKNPEATRATIDENGWIRTGDIGHVDKHGMLYVIDRLKEVIKYKAFQVSPAELEGVLLKHDKIADVGVVGMPDSYAGELPKAFVVRKDDSLTAKEVKEFVEGELVDYKQLRGGVEFIDVVPRSSLGKIQRGELKKMAGL